MRRIALAGLLLFILLAANPAQAQRSTPVGEFPSPETAVAFLFFGVEDKADGKLDGGDGTRWRLVSRSPAVLRVRGTRITVTRESACVFGVAQSYPNGPFKGRIDFSKITAWRSDGNDVRFEGDGVCLPGSYGCPAKTFALQVEGVAEERQARVYADLRDKVCPMR